MADLPHHSCAQLRNHIADTCFGHAKAWSRFQAKVTHCEGHLVSFWSSCNSSGTLEAVSSGLLWGRGSTYDSMPEIRVKEDSPA